MRTEYSKIFEFPQEYHQTEYRSYTHTHATESPNFARHIFLSHQYKHVAINHCLVCAMPLRKLKKTKIFLVSTMKRNIAVIFASYIYSLAAVQLGKCLSLRVRPLLCVVVKLKYAHAHMEYHIVACARMCWERSRARSPIDRYLPPDILHQKKLTTWL